MKIDFLYSPKCPNHEEAFQNLVSVLKKNGWPAGIHRIQIQDLNQAKRAEFWGSPTIRVNGHDLEENANKTERYSLDCRTLMINGKPSPVPTEDFIEAAIKRILEYAENSQN